MGRNGVGIIAGLVLALIAGHGPAAAATCSLPGEPLAISGLVRNTTSVGVAPTWNGTPVSMIPSDQPITLHLTMQKALNIDASGFTVVRRLNGNWEKVAVRSWQPAGNSNPSGDLVIDPIADGDLAGTHPQRLHIVVAACDGATVATILTGKADPFVSLHTPSVLVALAVTVILYVLGAVSLGQPAQWWKRLSPLQLALDGSGRASLSQMQIIFFSVIVLYLVTYILLRTGILASLSDNVLLLLGIAAAGSTGGQIATNNTQRLSLENWAWVHRKRWTAGSGFHVGAPQWSDLFSTNDVFDPYRFQMVSFSLVIGISLLFTGLNGLANFAVPTSLLALIGLSQATYIGGKITAPAGFNALDDQLNKLRDAQKDFLNATAATWVAPPAAAAAPVAPPPVPAAVPPAPAAAPPAPAAAAPLAPAAAPPAPLAAAKVSAPAKYLAFQTLVGPAKELFDQLFKDRNMQPDGTADGPDLEPDP